MRFVQLPPIPGFPPGAEKLFHAMLAFLRAKYGVL